MDCITDCLEEASSLGPPSTVVCPVHSGAIQHCNASQRQPQVQTLNSKSPTYNLAIGPAPTVISCHPTLTTRVIFCSKSSKLE